MAAIVGINIYIGATKIVPDESHFPPNAKYEKIKA
jgi:hypothetical protein